MNVFLNQKELFSHLFYAFIPVYFIFKLAELMKNFIVFLGVNMKKISLHGKYIYWKDIFYNTVTEF